MKLLLNLFFTANALLLPFVAQAACPDSHKVKIGDIGFKLNNQDELTAQTGTSIITPIALRENVREMLNSDPKFSSIPVPDRLGVIILIARGKREKDRGEQEKPLSFGTKNLDSGKLFKSVSFAPASNIHFFDFIVDRSDLKRPLSISFAIPKAEKVGATLDGFLTEIVESACQD